MTYNVDGSISSTVVNLFDSMSIDDYYVLFKVDDYTYTLAHGAKEDFYVGSSISGSDVELINYKRATSDSGYTNYYYIDKTQDDITVEYDSTIVYTNMVEYMPTLPSYQERGELRANTFVSCAFFLFFTLCVVFNLFGSLRFRVERRND